MKGGGGGQETVLDDTSAAFQGYLGWQMVRYIAAELSYIYFGDLESDDYLIDELDAKSTVKGDSISLGLMLTPGLFRWQTRSNKGNLEISPFLTAGWHKWDMDEGIKIASEPDAQEEYDGTDPYFGLGMKIKAKDGLYFRLEWRRMEFGGKVKSDVDMIYFGLWEDFGFSR